MLLQRNLLLWPFHSCLTWLHRSFFAKTDRFIFFTLLLNLFISMHPYALCIFAELLKSVQFLMAENWNVWRWELKGGKFEHFIVTTYLSGDCDSMMPEQISCLTTVNSKLFFVYANTTGDEYVRNTIDLI